MSLLHIVVSAAVALQISSGPTPQTPRDALRRGQYAEAFRLAHAALSTTPEDPNLWLMQALAQDGLHQSPDDFESIDHALKINPRFLPAAEAGAQIAYRTRDPRASYYLGVILAQQPDNATAHAMAGVLSFEKNDCLSAIDHFDKAGSLTTGNADAEMQLAVCHGKLGNPAAAIAHFEHLHATHPQNRAITYDLASMYVEEKHFHDAIQLLDYARSKYGLLDADCLNLLANAYADDGQVAQAVDAYRAAILLNPHDVEQYVDLAMLSMDHQSPDVALGVLDAGIRNNPDSAVLYTMRGSVYAQTAKNDDAQTDFETANRLSPSQVGGTIGLGVLLRDNGHLDEARAILESKLRTQKNDPVLNYMLAEILIRNGASPGQPEFEKAARLLHASISSRPDFAQAHAELGKLQIKADQLAEAIVQLETATRLDPTDRTALNQLIAAYRHSGRIQDAEHVASVLGQVVKQERAQETDKNRIHLMIEDQSTPAGHNSRVTTNRAP